MDNKELIKIAYELGADLNSVGMVVSALQKGIEIGKQEAIDEACEWLRNNLGYYDRHEVHIGKSYESVVIDDFRNAMENEVSNCEEDALCPSLG